ncbi:hypothetical protein [Mycolicibacterium sp.]|uniref:DUF7847 domain-containing protein n=1 Tax=Mycolicibacterium sp. TaxID=2320850 RepID=UPI001A2CB6CB|nr:hypothetical protein [Mycolicibacterium sp.]MBJ7339501.1 hypothetical protein [Mycolicibacterium sp.]
MVDMSSDAGGPEGTAPSPADWVPAYAQAQPSQQPWPTHPGYPPPGYPPPGHAPAPMPGPYGYGYPPMGPPPALKPGVIPLRPLGLSDIFNASIAYVRTNPKATLGLTTIVVVVAQVVALLLQIGPLVATGMLSPTTVGQSSTSEISDSAIIGLLLSSAAGIVTTALAGIVLSGLLTVAVGRAVFGATIGIGEAWRRVRGRLLPLLGVTALEAIGAAVLIAVVVGLVVAVSQIAGGPAAFVVGALFGMALVGLLVYLYTMLSFAPTLIVLERIGVLPAITRSFALVKNDFWRVFGIRLLAVVVAGVVSGAVTAPFSFVGQIMLMVGEAASTTVIAVVLISVGGAIGQIITAPFNAGVVVLLYTDRRIRAEAFDLVLQTGAAGPVDSTDDLWLTPRR